MTTNTTPPAAPFAAINGVEFPALPTRCVNRLLFAPATEPLVPLSPPLSDPFTPTTADLVRQAAHMMQIARDCDICANPGQPNNPYATVGAMRSLTESMHRWLTARLAAEERELLLLDRLRHEERHDKLMTTDGEYAAEFEDQVPHE